MSEIKVWLARHPDAGHAFLALAGVVVSVLAVLTIFAIHDYLLVPYGPRVRAWINRRGDKLLFGTERCDCRDCQVGGIWVDLKDVTSRRGEYKYIPPPPHPPVYISTPVESDILSTSNSAVEEEEE